MATKDNKKPRSGFVQKKPNEEPPAGPSTTSQNSCIFYRDFRPHTDPNTSTCFSTGYQSFSETVQRANEWLTRHEDCQIIMCESIFFGLEDDGNSTSSLVPDGWPTTCRLRNPGALLAVALTLLTCVDHLISAEMWTPKFFSDVTKEIVTGLFPIVDATGENLFNLIDNEIKNYGQNLGNCIGFASDGASNIMLDAPC
ncbi:uncharacterized protein LOC143028287 [Oratosquilla oratoria]|uniref:uncharacterized protein LOC143028287 n=1 Tax=Oratosquilla oratoria TaxID=337810 RepID=UPI003F771E5D